MELATQLVSENKHLRDAPVQKILFSPSNLRRAKKGDTSNQKTSILLGDVKTELIAENKLLINQ